MFSKSACPEISISKTKLSCDDLRVHHWTGRSIWLSGTGKNKVFQYRNGVMTNLGDLEISEWLELAQKVIEEHNEQDLFANLLQWEKSHNYSPSTKSEIQQKVLALHMARIFDDPHWVGYVSFNQLYRPEVLKKAKLVYVQTDCCDMPGQVTEEILERQFENRIPCPICGKWSNFTIIKSILEE